MKMCRSLVFFSSLLIPAISAQAQELTQKTPEKSSEAEQEGWTPSGVAAGQFNMDHSKDVVGQTNGSGQKYGLNLALGLKLKEGENRWTNKLDTNVGFTRTAALPRLVKSADDLKFVSMYTYSFELPPPVGPYARFSLQTGMFTGRAETAEEKTYQIASADGSSETKKTNSLFLTKAFQPVTTRESFGGFITLANEKELSSMARLGFGFEQFSGAKNEFKVSDNEDTKDVIEVTEMKDYKIAGIEGGANISSALNETTSLSAEGEFLYPLSVEDSVKGDKEGAELLNWELKAKLSTRIISWLSANYEFSAKKQPFVQSKAQIQNTLALQALYTFL
jgi:hypothetical protein